MTPPPHTTPLAGRLTVQAWFQLVLGLMALLVVIGAIVGAQLIAQTNRVADQLLDEIQPAAAETYLLQSALVNQETGIRGYVITADRQFLEPYLAGKQEEARTAARIRGLLADHEALIDDLEVVERAAEAWRTSYAEPVIAAITPGTRRAVDPTVAARGKQQFDELRTHFAAQNTAIATVVDHDSAELSRLRTIRDVTLGAMVVAFLLTGVALTFLVRRLVAHPLDYLEAESLRVAGGDFDHRITAYGPADLATVAEAVEAMRRRIVAELASSRVKETLLENQAADLDAQTLELRRSNTELEQFAYVASHDLQEPLRKITSFCQLLEKRYGDQLDERATQYIAYAVDGAKRMQVLINDLLTFSRVGRVNDSTVATSLDHTLDKALANLSAAAEDAGLRIHRPAQLPEIVGDPMLLTMLWQNLIANAIKFRRPGRPPIIQIECEPEEGDRPGWRISLTDNGIGIPAEFAEKVFVIFQRLHSREEYSGTGIGLALCKKIVEYHGGRIWIDSDHTAGTRFRFTLFDAVPPLETSDKEPST
ncbi:sensor histidine kinase [Nocardia sp. KC 131]|uniref:sensor histidine kinase n=1 Tax=Nocardia arseniciresistens TaxID=3392119 RepID=UPI00398F12E8